MSDLELRGVTKRYGSKPVLRDISLQVTDREFLAFVGPSGCGKSTLLRIVAGFEQPDQGEVLVGGKPINAVPPGGRGVAMVFQSYALYPAMTTAENMTFCLRNLRLSPIEIQRRLREVAQLLQIEALLERKPHEMSGGQRQRVAIGRAIIRNPKIYLFDEPLSNLDALLRVQMRLEIARMHQRFKTTTIYVTHDQVEAMTLADRIAVMKTGKIEQAGIPLELYRRPRNLFVAEFLGSPPMNFISGAVVAADRTGTKVQIPGGYFVEAAADASRHIPGTPVTIGIRPEHLQLSSDKKHPPMKVNVVERLGSRVLLYGTLGQPTDKPTAITIERFEDKGPDSRDRARQGEVVRVTVSPQLVHVFDAQGLRLPEARIAKAGGA